MIKIFVLWGTTEFIIASTAAVPEPANSMVVYSLPPWAIAVRLSEI